MKKIIFTLTLLALTAGFFAHSAYSSPLIYTPSLSSPANGAANQMPNVLLDWTAVSGANSYKIQVDTSSLFTNPIIYTTDLSAINASQLLFNTKYYWRVEAYDVTGDTSSWSVVYHFTTLNKLTQISPADSTISCPLDTLLRWKSVSGCTFVDIQLDTTLNYNSPFLSSYSVNSSLISSKPQGLHFGTFYYWRIRCRHSLDTSAWSSNWHITTKDTINLISPANSAINIDPSAKLQWSQITGITKQQYQTDTTNLFNSPKLTNGYTNVLVNNAYTDTFKFGSKLFWRVRAISNIDTSLWSLVRSFNVIDSVILSSPTNGQTKVSATPTLTWTKINAINGYEIQIDSSSNFTTTPSFYYPSKSLTQYKINTLKLGKTYYWRMRAINVKDTSLWSNVWSFSVAGVGINEYNLNSENILVYPNPASKNANIIFESIENKEITLSVIDLLGNNVREMKYNATSGKNLININVEGLSQGIYLIKVSDKNGSCIHKLTIN